MFPRIIGHRGLPHVAPENTMASFKAAVSAGAEGLETDVQRTKDGQLVLIHDETVDRTTDGKGLVADYTFRELRELDAGARFGKGAEREQIPALRELLEFLSGSGLFLNIEIKSGIVPYPGIEKQVIDLLHGYDIDVLLSSFNHYSLLQCKEIDSGIKTGVLYSCGLVRPWDYAASIGADALHPSFYSVNPEIMDGVRKSGLMINPYTVDRPDDIKKMIGLGVSGIITNDCDVLSKMKRESTSPAAGG